MILVILSKYSCSQDFLVEPADFPENVVEVENVRWVHACNGELPSGASALKVPFLSFYNHLNRRCISHSLIITREGFHWDFPWEILRVSGCKTHGRRESLKISRDPREISRVSGNLGRRGWIFQYLPPLGGARIQCSSVEFPQHNQNYRQDTDMTVHPSLRQGARWAF